MKRSPIFDALNPNEYRMSDRSAYGVVEGFPFAMIQTASRRLLLQITAAAPLENQAVKAVRGELVQQGIRASMKGRVLSYQLKIDRNTLPGQILTTVSGAVSALRRFGASAPGVCALCGGPGADACMVYGGRYDAVHAACADQLQSAACARASENPGSYGMGILGGLIGAVAGALPAFLAIQFLHVVSAWLFMLIPIATYYGYKKLGGKMNRGATLFSLLLSLVGLGAVLFFWDVAQNIQFMSMRLGEALSYTVQSMFLPGYWSWLGGNLVTIVAFYILGLVFSLGVVCRTNQSDVKSVDQMRGTLLLRQSGGGSAPADTARAEAAAPVSASGDDPWNLGGPDLSEKDWKKLK